MFAAQNCDGSTLGAPPSPADLRAEIARRRVYLYYLAAAVGLNPSRLGAMLGERIPMPDGIAARLAEALEGMGQGALDA